MSSMTFVSLLKADILYEVMLAPLFKGAVNEIIKFEPSIERTGAFISFGCLAASTIYSEEF